MIKRTYNLLVAVIIAIVMTLSGCKYVNQTQKAESTANKIVTATSESTNPSKETPTPIAEVERLNQEFINNNIIIDEENQTVTIKCSDGNMTFNGVKFVSFKYVNKLYSVTKGKKDLGDENVLIYEDPTFKEIQETSSGYYKYKKRLYSKDIAYLEKVPVTTLQSKEGLIILEGHNKGIKGTIIRNDGYYTSYCNTSDIIGLSQELLEKYITLTLSDPSIALKQEYNEIGLPYYDSLLYAHHLLMREGVTKSNADSYLRYLATGINSPNVENPFLVALKRSIVEGGTTEYEDSKIPVPPQNDYVTLPSFDLILAAIELLPEEIQGEELIHRLNLINKELEMKISFDKNEGVNEAINSHYTYMQTNDMTLNTIYSTVTNFWAEIRYSSGGANISDIITLDGVEGTILDYMYYMEHIKIALQLEKSIADDLQLFSKKLSEATVKGKPISLPTFKEFKEREIKTDVKADSNNYTRHPKALDLIAVREEKQNDMV